MADTNNSINVTVKEAAYDDAGQGIARVSMDAMRALGLVSGDVIEIEDKRKAYAIVWPGFRQDAGRAIVRIDGSTRGNAGTGVNEQVRIRKVQSAIAKKIVIQPAQPYGRSAGDEQYLKRNLIGRPVFEGAGFRVFGISNPLTFVITKVTPKGIAIVSDETEVELKETLYQQKGEEEEKGERTDVHYEDIGGLGRELDQIREMIELPLRHPEIFERLGITPPKGVLLYGPPGTGKTLIAKAVANEVDAHFLTISGPEIMSKFYGESEGNLRQVFEEAQEKAPSIIFIDEIDSIAPKREDTKGEVERRVVAQLLSLMDGLKGRGQVVVIGATNIPDSIDPALRRGGRFDREIEIGIPDTKGREEIFRIHTRGVPLSKEITGTKDMEEEKAGEQVVEDKGPKKEEKKPDKITEYAATTHGFVGADIALLVKEAAMHALRRVLPSVKADEEIPAELLDKLEVTDDDFTDARKYVEPSGMREVLVEVPDVTWADIGGLEEVKAELQETVEWPLKYAEVFEQLRTEAPKGVLLFGPPGTGKTMLAKAVANESDSNFISIKGPELLSKWVGESEKGVRDIFRRARQAAPAIIFFDEVDALVPVRGLYQGSSHVTESVVSQILTELDGLEELKNVVVLAATNRPDMIDPALLRPGRLDRHVYVPPPDEEGRKKIFDVYLGQASDLLAGGISVDDLVARTEGFVGADIEALVREAKLAAMREFISVMSEKTDQERADAAANIRLTKAHFDVALEKVRGSLDRDAVEAAERQAWEMMYNQEQRSVLEEAAAVVRRAELATMGVGPENELRQQADALRRAVFARKKDFAALRDQTAAMRERLDKPR